MGKATKGSFYSNGRRKQPTTKAERMAQVETNKRVLPTPETVAYVDRRLNYWMVPGLWNRASAEQCFDNAGILWATGWFDDHGFQPDAIRDIFRKYARLYWQWYGATAPHTSKGERVGKAEPGIHKQEWEKAFQKLDERLPLASPERLAVHQLCVNGWHFDEMDPRAVALANLGRVKLNARRKEKLPIAGEIAGDREMEWLRAALRGAFALLDAEAAKKVKRGWDIPLWALNDDGEEKAA